MDDREMKTLNHDGITRKQSEPSLASTLFANEDKVKPNVVDLQSSDGCQCGMELTTQICRQVVLCLLDIMKFINNANEFGKLGTII